MRGVDFFGRAQRPAPFADFESTMSRVLQHANAYAHAGHSHQLTKVWQQSNSWWSVEVRGQEYTSARRKAAATAASKRTL
mmetsp:Transcript_28284/g.77361  ORF Transcript_28284/g.77361 Transcript_28284/m.77361 type:complete len:80 (+) Transcript_28284:295-534(+)